MTNWDDDSPQLRRNLSRLFARVRDDAVARLPLTSDVARNWHRDMMKRLVAPDPIMVGTFRGERGLQSCEVRVGSLPGVSARRVKAALRVFDRTLRVEIGRLDRSIPVGHEVTARDLAEVLELCAWAHAEWVRIHPLANGNGRTARMWANSIAMRYGVPPFVRIRPRPGGEYGRAAEAAMRGDVRPTITMFHRMYVELMSA